MKMQPFSLCIRGKLFEYDRPIVAGILNVTPDSFYSGSRTYADIDHIKYEAERLGREGASIIDVGAYSSRPGASDVSEMEEIDRLGVAFDCIRNTAAGDLPVSIDTFRSKVARVSVEELGADIVNDISGGDLDNDMFRTVANLGVPYILMHMRGTPSSMQSMCDYGRRGVVATVISSLSDKIRILTESGVNDIIVDPGFGFAKTIEQNYELLNHLSDMIRVLQRPLLVGLSRKSMLSRPLGINADESLNATTAANMYALVQGASILRVHDVRAAKEVIEIKCLIDQNDNRWNHLD